VKKVILCFLLFYVYSNTYSQSLGLTLESFPITIISFGESGNAYGNIKNLMVTYNAPIKESFILSLKAGYGSDSYTGSYDSKQISPFLVYSEKYEYKTSGIPIETELVYHHFVSSDSIFEATLGVGLGYCHYKTTIDQNFYHVFITSGFNQSISLGMNIHIHPQIICSIGINKIFYNSIKTREESSTTSYISVRESDDWEKPGLSGVSLYFGVYFNL
jgi:hypothetical protein